MDCSVIAGWRLWTDAYFDRTNNPYLHTLVEIARPEWEASFQSNPATLDPAMNVAGLWWRPVASG